VAASGNGGTWLEVKAKGADVEHIPGSIVCDPYMGTDFIVHSGGPTHCWDRTSGQFEPLG
jgi:hypothetical protein